MNTKNFICSCVVLSALLVSAEATAQTAKDVVCTGCVNTGDLAANSVSSAKIGSGAVTSAQIQDATIALADLSADARERLNRGMPVYAGGTLIGYLFQSQSENPPSEAAAAVISSKGYLFDVTFDGGCSVTRGLVTFPDGLHGRSLLLSGGGARVAALQGIVFPSASGAL